MFLCEADFDGFRVWWKGARSWFYDDGQTFFRAPNVGVLLKFEFKILCFLDEIEVYNFWQTDYETEFFEIFPACLRSVTVQGERGESGVVVHSVSLKLSFSFKSFNRFSRVYF